MQRYLMGKLLKWKGSKGRKPLLLKGVRQVGKTYLLKEFGREHFPQVHYFNFEKQEGLKRIFEQDLDPKRIVDELAFYQNALINVGRDLVIFDEIQEVPRALTSLKYFQEECSELHLVAAGSLLGIHLNSASFPVGKVTFETLRPLSFEEFLLAGKDKALPFLEKREIPEVVHTHLWEQFKHYLVVGGLPEVVATYWKMQEKPFEAFAEVRKRQDDLLKAYYADIAKHSGKVGVLRNLLSKFGPSRVKRGEALTV